MSLGLCPTKLPVIWDIWPDQPDVPVFHNGKRLSQEPPDVHVRRCHDVSYFSFDEWMMQFSGRFRQGLTRQGLFEMVQGRLFLILPQQHHSTIQ